MHPNRLFNLKIIADIMLRVDIKWPFNNDAMKKYVTFSIIEGALGGMFAFRSPREYVEGYTDATINALTTQPVYKGGD